MNKSNQGSIRHDGTVCAVSGGVVSVRIVQTSACAGCKIAASCRTSESKEKIIEICDAAAASRLRVGDSVTVAMTAGMALKALLLGYVYPFALLLVVLFASMALTASEPKAAACACASLIPYYTALYLLRGHIGGRFTVTAHLDEKE